MSSFRLATFVAISLVAMLVTGCGVVVTTTIPSANTKQATEDRNLAVPHVGSSGIDITTPNGAIEVIADPALTEVKVAVKVTAFGETEEEAKNRLDEIKVKWNRRTDQVLEITSEIPKDTLRGVQGACSFVVRVPDAKGCKARSGNGSMKFQGLSGHADGKTDNGSILIANQTGSVMVKSGSGTLSIVKSDGDVDAQTDNGSVKVTDARGNVKIKSGSGAIEVSKPGGIVTAHTDNGPITVQDGVNDVTATSGSGQITVKQVKGTVKTKTDNGPVSLEQLFGPVEAQSGSGSISYIAAANSNSSFNLKTDNGPLTVRLPGSAGGTVQARTDNGRITVNGSRKPSTVTGERESKKIVISDQGPSSKIHTGSGNITVTID